MAICFDKQITNRTAKAIGVPTPHEVFLTAGPGLLDRLNDPGSFESRRIRDELNFPLFVKPAQGDNSYGIFTSNIIDTWGQLVQVVGDLIYKFQVRDLCVQEYLSGKEYGIGMIGNPECGAVTFLPILEVDFSRIEDRQLPTILGYESKWDPESPYWNEISYVRAKSLTRDQELLLQSYALKLFTRFGCRDYARFDFRADAKGTIKLLEVNPNPGWCWDGKLNHMASHLGLDYPTLLKAIIAAGEKRLYNDSNSSSGGKIIAEPIMSSSSSSLSSSSTTSR